MLWTFLEVLAWIVLIAAVLWGAVRAAEMVDDDRRDEFTDGQRTLGWIYLVGLLCVVVALIVTAVIYVLPF